MKLAAAAAAACLLVLEVALRVIGYSAPQWYELDPVLGWRLHPHRHGWFIADGARIAVNTTPAGFRDREHTLDKPDGVYRIAVLGDEYSEAMSVPLTRTWWWQLPARLQECGFQPDKLTEVLNFGVGGYGTTQEYVLLETTAMRYQPDLVLLQFSPNDVTDNSRALTSQKDRPFFVLDAHGVPRLDDSFSLKPSFDDRMQTRYRLGEEIADHSRAYQLGRQLAQVAFIGEARADAALFTEDAWKVTAAVMTKMNTFTGRNGARLAVVSVPESRRMEQGMGVLEHRLAAFAQQTGVPVIGVPAEHAMAARVVAQRLCGATRQPG